MLVVVTDWLTQLGTWLERFSNDCRKTKPKQLLRPITIGTNSSMSQSQFLAITCNSLEEREKSRVHDAVGFGFASHWLKNWRESFKPITKRSKRNHVITFDSNLKTALKRNNTELPSNQYIPSGLLPSRVALEDSIWGKDSSSPRSLFLLISSWQNTSMTGWLWATRTLRNPRYATKAARDKSCLDFVFKSIFPNCSWC